MSLKASSEQAEGHHHGRTLWLGFNTLQCSLLFLLFLLSIRALAHLQNITPEAGSYFSLVCLIALSYRGSFIFGSLTLSCRRQFLQLGSYFCPGVPHGHQLPLFTYRASVQHFLSQLKSHSISQVLMTEKLSLIYFTL